MWAAGPGAAGQLWEGTGCSGPQRPAASWTVTLLQDKHLPALGVGRPPESPAGQRCWGCAGNEVIEIREKHTSWRCHGDQEKHTGWRCHGDREKQAGVVMVMECRTSSLISCWQPAQRQAAVGSDLNTRSQSLLGARGRITHAIYWGLFPGRLPSAQLSLGCSAAPAVHVQTPGPTLRSRRSSWVVLVPPRVDRTEEQRRPHPAGRKDSGSGFSGVWAENWGVGEFWGPWGSHSGMAAAPPTADAHCPQKRPRV